MRPLFYLILGIQCFSEASGFILSSCGLRPCKNKMIYGFHLSKVQNEGNMTKTNTSKLMKLDFTEETEEEWLFKPRYRFGLSEYDMILLRIYVYIAITIHFVLIFLEKLKK